MQFIKKESNQIIGPMTQTPIQRIIVHVMMRSKENVEKIFERKKIVSCKKAEKSLGFNRNIQRQDPGIA